MWGRGATEPKFRESTPLPTRLAYGLLDDGKGHDGKGDDDDDHDDHDDGWGTLSSRPEIEEPSERDSYESLLS